MPSLKRPLLFLLLSLTCYSDRVHAEEMGSVETTTPVLQSVPEAPQMATPVSLVDSLNLLSPSKESFLNVRWPLIGIGIEPETPSLDLESLGYFQVKEINNKPSDWEIKEYQKIITAINSEMGGESSKITFAVEKKYLKAYLTLLISRVESKEEVVKDAHSLLKKFILENKDSEFYLPAVYNLGLLYLEAGNFRQASSLANQYALRFENDKKWVHLFRSLSIESYYARGRYLRAEDFLWDLATKISKEELIPHLALRYADSLFWQGKYPAVAEWFKNTQVHSYLDDSTEIKRLSRLYYAESLFQTADYEEALKQFNLIQKYQLNLRESADLLRYRILECEIALEPDIKKSIARLYTFALKESMGTIQTAAIIEWSRLLVKSKNNNQTELTSAHALLSSHSLKKMSLPQLKETLLMRAMLEYNINDKRTALATLARITPRKFIQDLKDPFIAELSAISLQLLEELAPSYWEVKDYAGYLIQCDRFSQLIQVSKKRESVLIWVGRAYIDTGMPASATRLFERLIFEQTGERKNRMGLELARAYGLIGETESMGKALELVTEVPTDPAEKNLYYLTRATYYVAMEDYQGCLSEFDKLMQKGVQGDDFFELAYQTSVCARKAHSFEKAEQYLSLLGVSDDKLNSDVIPEVVKDWQKKSLYEKVNLLVDQEKYDFALAVFEKVNMAQTNAIPPLETIFLLIKAYRQQSQPDAAVQLWKDYAEKSKSLPRNFKEEYARLLEMLTKMELVPMASSSVEI